MPQFAPLLIISIGIIQILAAILAVFIAVPFMQKEKDLVPEGQVSKDPLTSDERGFIWILLILSPIISHLILYFGWRDRLPTKAREIHLIGLISILICVGIFLGMNYASVASGLLIREYF